MQGQKRPVRHSLEKEQREDDHGRFSPGVERSIFGWETWPGWWRAKSRPLGPWAESGEKMPPWVFCVADWFPLWGE